MIKKKKPTRKRKRFKFRPSRGKSGYYKGIWCDSSWELAFVLYNIDHNISFIRNEEKFTYTYRGRNYKWIPDFIVDGSYIEIKGWMRKRDEAKINSFQKPLIILRAQDLKPILKYVTNNYGKDFIRLYEK
jgi:hypothetical protein